MQTMSKEAEQRIIDAVGRAVRLVDNDGMTPTAAMSKVAGEEKWGADMIKFASQAYNTGRQTAQREASENALDKFAGFPLVDPDAVIAAIYPTAKAAEDVSSEYQLPPTWLTRQAAPRPLTKAASCKCPNCGCDPCKGKDCTGDKPKLASFNQLHREKVRLQKAAEDARHDAAATYERLLVDMGDLRKYFKKFASDRLPFAQVDYAVQAYHGAGGKALMDWVYKAAALREPRYDATKVAAFTLVDEKVQPWSLVKACMDGAKAVTAKRAAHEAAMAAVEKAGQALRPFAAPSPSPAPPGAFSLLDEKQAGVGQVALGASVATGTKELLEKALRGGESKDERVQDVWQDLDDPVHDAQLRQIRTQAMMSDMMNDEVIGSYDPDQVARAFNDISSLAPRTSGQPLAMRSLLRRHLQGNVEPFEARELAGMEKDLRSTQGVAPDFDKDKEKGNAAKPSIFG